MTKNIVVVGGGIAGLVAATQAARNGASVILLEKASTVGGRASTREKHGYLFNLGPHALYRRGALRQTLRTFGIDPKGAIPGGNGGFAIYQGRRHTLPTGLTSLLTTGLLNLPAKIEFAKLLTGISAIDAEAVASETLESWLDRNIRHGTVREVVKMLVRVTSFTNDPAHQSAGAAIEQLQLGAKGNVLYLDGGWQTIVDALRQKALASGVDIRSGSPAIAIERRGWCAAEAVRLADGSRVPATTVILTGSPSETDAIAGTTYGQTLPPPVRVATLDIGLRSLPNPKRLVAFGVDVPLYFSVHSAVAKLAPPGAALIHVSQYLRPDEHADARVERALEDLVDNLQPGWRNVLATRQFVPNLAVTNAEATAAQGGLRGRPSTRIDAFENVFVAGDWVGPRGQLSDAAAASAMDAAAAAVSQQATAVA